MRGESGFPGFPDFLDLDAEGPERSHRFSMKKVAGRLGALTVRDCLYSSLLARVSTSFD